MPIGTIIRLDTASCLVLAEGRTARCAYPGKWRLGGGVEALPVAAGDRVAFSLHPTGDGVVESVEPRHGGVLSRKAAGDRDIEQVVAANVDQLVVVVAAAEPPLNRKLLDRLIVSGEHGDLGIVVCLNKIDLVDPARFEPALDVYRRLAYCALSTSALTGAGIDAFREVLRGKTSVFAGPSGAGKSTLLMAVQPGLELRVQTVSESTGKGRHTTTAVSLLPLDVGGYVLDTPGIREFGLYDIDREVLKHHFPEITERLGKCRFADCAHINEPGCAITQAVEAGQIDAERYESYCHIYESLGETAVPRRPKEPTGKRDDARRTGRMPNARTEGQGRRGKSNAERRTPNARVEGQRRKGKASAEGQVPTAALSPDPAPRDVPARAVIFDLDGVLVDSEQLHVDAWKILFARQGISVSEEEYAHGIGMADVDWVQYLFERRGQGVDAAWWQDAKRVLYRDILTRNVRPLPGVVELVRRLWPEFRLAVASNSWREDIEIVLRALDIRPCFDALTGKEDVARHKPDPEAYTRTAAALGLEPAACTVIEDSPLGIRAAKAAGMRCAGVATSLPADRLAQADLVLPSLDDPEPVLRFIRGIRGSVGE